MEPQDFIDLADQLSLSGSEAENRTAVSRAYYGAFHLAWRLVVDRCGVVIPINEAHAKLAYCLTSGSQNEHAKIAGSTLATLREARRIADYELSDSNPANSRWVRLQIDLSKDAVQAIGQCCDEPELREVSEGIRGYARDVLSLHLRDT